jgi:hypothetical protein
MGRLLVGFSESGLSRNRIHDPLVDIHLADNATLRNFNFLNIESMQAQIVCSMCRRPICGLHRVKTGRNHYHVPIAVQGDPKEY